MIAIDNFINDFDRLKQYSFECEYQDEVNPSDGVVYPLICKDIPQEILNDIFLNLNHKVFARAPKNPICFFRMSPQGVPVPHKFHTDNSMGQYSMMLYLQDNKDAGTGFAVHKNTGASQAPDSNYVLQETIKDCNNDNEWVIYNKFEMKQNRAVIFDSRLFHVALPIGGFGKAKEDSRTVFTCFFN